MGNNTYHYFGAYVEIKVKKQTVTRISRECASGHTSPTGDYCQQCGLPLIDTPYTLEHYPTYIADWILGDEWEDVLAEITPPSLHETGVILAKGNEGINGDDWLYLTGGRERHQVLPFPSPKEIDAMKAALAAGYADAIDALRQSELVESVEIKAGYVLDADY